MSNVQRARNVLGWIGKMPEADRPLAQDIYYLILRVELFSWSWPNSFGMLAVGLGALISIAVNFQPPLSGAGKMAGILALCLLLYGFGFWLSKLLIFNRLRDQQFQEMKALQFSDSRFNQTLKTLKELDPRIEVNLAGV